MTEHYKRMKTPEEIKKGLTCVCDTPDCEKCAYATKVNDDEFGEILQFHCSQIYEDAYELICQLEQRLAQAERERDAMLLDMQRYSMCGACKHFVDGKKCPMHEDCDYAKVGHFEWRGVCEENSKESSHDI